MTPIGQWKRLDRVMVECAVYYTSAHCKSFQLHNFDLFRTCRTSSFCTVAWQLARFQLTRRIARSSAIAELLVSSCSREQPASSYSPHGLVPCIVTTSNRCSRAELLYKLNTDDNNRLISHRCTLLIAHVVLLLSRFRTPIVA